jgi:hypothetical protein
MHNSILEIPGGMILQNMILQNFWFVCRMMVVTDLNTKSPLCSWTHNLLPILQNNVYILQKTAQQFLSSHRDIIDILVTARTLEITATTTSFELSIQQRILFQINTQLVILKAHSKPHSENVTQKITPNQ